MIRRAAIATLVRSQLFVCAWALFPAVIYAATEDPWKGIKAFLVCSLVPTPFLLWGMRKQLRQRRRL
jgi:hypothetical protein